MPPPFLVQDFHELLPLPLYTHTTSGPLNLATFMPEWALATDLGPKTYVAFGQVNEGCTRIMHASPVVMRASHWSCSCSCYKCKQACSWSMCHPVQCVPALQAKLLPCAGLQTEEHERVDRDSVTKLHQDMSDAVNTLVCSQ